MTHEDRRSRGPRRDRRPLAALALAVAISSSVGWQGTAHAQSGDAAAQMLFDEGKALLSAGKYGDACPKFAESHRLAPNGGTLSNLAECLELQGRLASAWLRYKELAARANAAKQSGAEKRALEKAAALEAKLPRLTIAVTARETPGLEVLRDGVRVDRAEWDLAVPVDPGPHKVEARAPGHRDFSDSVSAPAERTLLTVKVPELAESPAEPAAPLSPPVAAPAAPREQAPAPSGGNMQRTIGLAAAGLGLVATGVGIVFGVQAKSKNDEALEPDNCPSAQRCHARGLELTDDAKSASTLSTIGFVAGGALLAGGAVLFFTAPRSDRPRATRVRAVPQIGGLSLEGTFQ
jgi:tetratricopeptide (TPR) repeat protein